ncbi:N-acetylmuramoyl-L-alanine amidase [Virgibacillus halophilus]|uniref:N-acetylmuramoyl-L-alanine amidase n=1 Tax=Tigheibacillus halophilus TaxID=361280 RepID=UPI00363FC4E7
MKLFIDPGHGGSDAGAQGYGLKEKDLTLAISKKLAAILEKEYDCLVKLSRTKDEYLSLDERTNMANSWKADYLLSVHINAGGGSGFESYIYNGSYAGKAQTEKLRSIIHEEVVKQTGFSNRGKKEDNFHMVRESAMPAVLTENGFIDFADDANKLKSAAFQEKIARGHAAGLAKAFNLKKKEVTKYIEILADSLWTYHTANWDDKAVIVHKGEVFTIIKDKFPVGDGHMYQIKSGLFITANPTYVKER